TAQASVGREDAEDVAQDALLLAFKALPTIEEPSRFAAWLSAITRHRALRFSQSEDKHLRRRVAIDEALVERIGALATPFTHAALATTSINAATTTSQALEDRERDEEMLR